MRSQVALHILNALADGSRALLIGPFGVGFTGHAAHIGIMVRTAANIRFDVCPMKTGQTWMVVVTFPDRADLEVTDFGTEADARKWIANESQAWLRKLGYGNE